MSFVTTSRNRGNAFVQAVLSQDAATIAAQEAEIARRVRNEVNRLRADAEAQARTQADAQARETLAQRDAAVNTALAALAAAQAQLAAPLAQKEQDLAALATELAFLLARHIIGVEAAANPAGLQNLLTRLIAEAEAERQPRQTLLIRLHPTDHTYLTPHVPPEVAQLLAGKTIAQGGALLEIVTPDGDPAAKTEWDATIPTRLNTIRTALALPGSAAP